jgi:hypothetical protein
MFKPEYIIYNRIDWDYLSYNPNAIPILEKNLDKVVWYYLLRNPNAIHLLEKNLDKVDWYILSGNPNAIHLFARLDTDLMRNNCRPFAEDLAKYVCQPLRLKNLSSSYGLEIYEYFDSI